jgi:hypothetical protein
MAFFSNQPGVFFLLVFVHVASGWFEHCKYSTVFGHDFALFFWHQLWQIPGFPTSCSSTQLGARL